MSTVSTGGATRLVGRFIAETPGDFNSADDRAFAKRSLVDAAFAFSVSAAQDPTSPFLGLNRDDVNGVELCGVRLPATRGRPRHRASPPRLDRSSWTTWAAVRRRERTAICGCSSLAWRRLTNITDESQLLDAWCFGVRVGVALWTAGRYRQADRGFDGTDVFGSMGLRCWPEPDSSNLTRRSRYRRRRHRRLGDGRARREPWNCRRHLARRVRRARDGFQAALLARAGIYGATDVLEARQGFGEAIFGPADGPLFATSVHSWNREFR